MSRWSNYLQSKRRNMKIFELTMLFIGAIIGAGFATGAEIVTFFNKFALPVWLIAVLVGVTMFCVMSVSILLAKTNSQPQTTFIGYLFITLYFVFFVAMTAAVTQVAGVFVSLLALVFSGLVVKFGFHKMTRINTFIVICIIIVLFGVCLPHVLLPPRTATNWHDLPGGMLWAFLYAGLNCFMFPELIAAAVPQHQKRTLYLASLLAAAIIAFFVYMILTAIKFTGTQNAVMPLLATSNHPVTFVVILLAILTSQYSSLFAIVQKAQTLTLGKKVSTDFIIIIFTILAFICSFLGFEKILNIGYPLVGAFICAFLCFSLLVYLRTRQPARH